MKFLTRLIGCLLILGLCQCSEADEDTQQTPHSSLGFPSVQEGAQSPQIGAVGEVDFEIEDQTRLPILQTGIEKMSQSLYAIASSDRERSRKLYHKDSQTLLEGEFSQIQKIDQELDTLTAKRDGERVWIHGVDVSDVSELIGGTLLRAEAGRAIFVGDDFHVNGSRRAVTFVDYDASGIDDTRFVETSGLERIDTVTDEEWVYAVEWLSHPMVGIFAVNLETEREFEVQIESYETFDVIPLTSGVLIKAKTPDGPEWWIVDPDAGEALPISVPWDPSKDGSNFHLLSNRVAIVPGTDEVHFIKSADEIVSIPCSGPTQLTPRIPSQSTTYARKPTTSREDDPRFIGFQCGGLGGLVSGQLVVFNTEKMEETDRVDTSFLDVSVSLDPAVIVWTELSDQVNVFSLERGYTVAEVPGTSIYSHPEAFIVYDGANENQSDATTLVLPDGRIAALPDYSFQCRMLRVSDNKRAITYIAMDRTLRYMDVGSGVTETLAGNVYCDEIVARDDMRKGFVRYGAKFTDGVVEWAPDTSRNLFESNQIRELSQHGEAVAALGSSLDASGGHSTDFLFLHHLGSDQWHELATLPGLDTKFSFDSNDRGWLVTSSHAEGFLQPEVQTWFGLWENPGWATNLGPGEFELRETAGEVWVVERRDEGDRFMELRPPK